MSNNSIVEYLRKNWGNKTLSEIQFFLQIDLYELLVIAFNNNLHKLKTDNISRLWTKEEEQFLVNYAEMLSTVSASNLLYRSRHAVYERANLLNIYPKMIKKKRKV